MWGSLEYAWCAAPATPFSSGVMLFVHVTMLSGLFVRAREESAGKAMMEAEASETLSHHETLTSAQVTELGSQGELPVVRDVADRTESIGMSEKAKRIAGSALPVSGFSLNSEPHTVLPAELSFLQAPYTSVLPITTTFRHQAPGAVGEVEMQYWPARDNTRPPQQLTVFILGK
jgi:hypothetical protein